MRLRHRHSRLWILCAFTIVACQSAPPSDNGPQAVDGAVPATPEARISTLTDVVDGDIVVTSTLLENGNIDTEIRNERTHETLAKGWYNETASTWDYTLLDESGRGEVQQDDPQQSMTLALCNQRLADAWLATKHVRLNRDGLVPYDDPGCDDIELWVPGDSHCSQDCCALHDKCYRDLGCSAASWGGTEGPACKGCNYSVMACIGDCAVLGGKARTLTANRNTCATGHRCYDVDCSAGRTFYCAQDCYREPSPCDSQNPGEVWYVDRCRDGNGRMAWYVDSRCVTSTGTLDGHLPGCPGGVATCDSCKQVGFVRCKDDRCPFGRIGYCASVCDNAHQSPCCGGLGEPCCSYPFFSTDPSPEWYACWKGDRDRCVAGTCVDDCGAPGEPCCQTPHSKLNTSCDTGAICNLGTSKCQTCGQPNTPCCSDGSCGMNSVCSTGTCVACGTLGKPCCTSGTACDSQTLCKSNVCSGDCGIVGKPCCSGGTCPGTGICSNGSCVQPKPDLIVSDAWLHFDQWGNLMVFFRVINIGHPLPSGAYSYVMIEGYDARGNLITDCADCPEHYCTPGVACEFDIHFNETGLDEIRIVADYYDYVDESDESNNARWAAW